MSSEAVTLGFERLPTISLPSPSWKTVGLAASIPVALIGGSLVIQVCKQAYARWQLRRFPGPRPSLLVGNIPEIFAMGGSHVAIQKWIGKYGRVFKMFITTNGVVVLADPEMARAALFKLTNHTMLRVVPRGSARAIQGPNVLMDDNGLVQARDGFWRMLRNAWQPVFAPGTLQRYTDLMESCAQQLCSMLRDQTAASGTVDITSATKPATTNGHRNGHGDGKEAAAAVGKEMQKHEEEGRYIDIHEQLMNLTLEVVGTCAYGVKFGALAGHSSPHQDHGPGKDISNAVKVFFQGSTLKSSSQWTFAMAVLPPMAYFIVPFARLFPDAPLKRLRQAGVTIRQTASRLIADWRTQSHGTNTVADALNAKAKGKNAPSGPLEGVDQGSFLGLMLAAQAKARARMEAGNKDTTNSAQGQVAAPSKSAASATAGALTSDAAAIMMDDKTITSQANTFILAGTETTATALTFCIYLLSQHPGVVSKLLAEIDTHDWTKPMSQTNKFPYTDAVINETLRLFPPAHTTSRDVEREEGLDVGGLHLPRGTSVFLPIYAFHHDPEYWPRAEEFLPERWLPEHQSEWGPTVASAYMPFGAGTRQCPGYKFALQEARIALAQLYRHFTFELAPGQIPLQCTAGITLTPKHGLRVRLLPRTLPVL